MTARTELEEQGMDPDPIVIVGSARTPMGAFQGELSSFSAHQLGSVAIGAALERSGVQPGQVDEVIMGCVLPAGQGQAPARQAALGAGLPVGVGCTTVNKMCGSGMRAAMYAYDALKAGSSDIIVAGGMESMTNAPFLLTKARGGYRMGQGAIYDHMMMDGLEDAYDIAPDGTRRSMGTFGEDCATAYGFTREQQDHFATTSVTRAQAAASNGTFDAEIAPVTVRSRTGDAVVDSDEGPRKARLEKIPTLRPAFRKDGTITAASSSSINDGAAALVMMRASTAEALGLKTLARVLGHTTNAKMPAEFTTAPVGAIQKLYDKLGWKTEDVDLFEINEAFAVVPMAAMKEHGIPHDKVNVHGGACALGHPIGASGARLVVALINALNKTGGKKGVASLCIGGGEATAMAIEVP
jgi:acetyl-CoA C-acetyltransferase